MLSRYELHALYTNSTEHLRITSAGTLAIGLSAPDPAYKLDTNGDGVANEFVSTMSDVRLKKNIATLAGALDQVKQLRAFALSVIRRRIIIRISNQIVFGNQTTVEAKLAQSPVS